MSGCLDNVHCSCPDWGCCEFLREIEWSDHRNRFASILSGVFFFVGWWLIIDAAAYPGWCLPSRFHVVGVVSTIAFFMVNAISNGQLTGESYTEGSMGQRGARVWMFIGFLMTFAGLIAAAWILFGFYVVPSHSTSSNPTQAPISTIPPTGNSTVNTTTHPINATTSVFTSTFLTTGTTRSHTPCNNHAVWQGVAVFLQNFFIFIGSMVFKFLRSEDLWE